LKTAAAGTVAFLAQGREGYASQESPVRGADKDRQGRDRQGRSQLVIKDPAHFRILQFTDIHFFGGHSDREKWKDPKTIENMAAFVKRSKPHVLAVTGDLWFNNPQGRGAEFMAFAIEKLEALGVPWLFTWGNHDQLDDYGRGHDAFARAKHSLYRGQDTDGNYIVEVLDTGGQRLWNLVCINSGPSGIQESQRAWILNQAAVERTLGGGPRAFAFFHIPIRQYEEAWTQGVMAGEKKQRVMFESEAGKALGALKALNVRACFCGHDHVNDFAGMADGVELVYGRATGYAGYGREFMEKGCKLISVDCLAGKFQWTTLLPDGKTWDPARITRTQRSQA
jgi:hypothetical protein